MPAKKKGRKAKPKAGPKGKAVTVANPKNSGQHVQKKKSGAEVVEREPFVVVQETLEV